MFRHFPWLELHPHAELAAEAAEAAAAQGRFWEMHHLLFTPPHDLGMSTLAAHAQAIGLDMIRFNAEMADRIYTQRIQEHRRAGERSGLRTNPPSSSTACRWMSPSASTGWNRRFKTR